MIIKCIECKKEISSEAKTCPHCGTPINKPTNWVGGILWLLVAYFLIKTLFSFNQDSIPSPATFKSVKMDQALTMPTQYHYKEPRLQESRSTYLSNNPNLPENVKEAILNGTICIGMSKDMVLASWGKPYHVNKSVGKWGDSEQLSYDYICSKNTYNGICQAYLYIENGILTSWQEGESR